MTIHLLVYWICTNRHIQTYMQMLQKYEILPNIHCIPNASVHSQLRNNSNFWTIQDRQSNPVTHILAIETKPCNSKVNSRVNVLLIFILFPIPHHTQNRFLLLLFWSWENDQHSLAGKLLEVFHSQLISHCENLDDYFQFRFLENVKQQINLGDLIYWTFLQWNSSYYSLWLLKYLHLLNYSSVDYLSSVFFCCKN